MRGGGQPVFGWLRCAGGVGHGEKLWRGGGGGVARKDGRGHEKMERRGRKGWKGVGRKVE